MNVFLTFDIEVWCNGWDNLDKAFPASFERYVYGRSPHGNFALPETLAILNQHGLRGVFFVEPLFAARFGIRYLETIVQLIQEAGHEVQLHLHPEWTDEARPPIIANSASKRQHMTFYSVDEQTQLIAHGKRMLQDAGSAVISVFRSGSFAANRDTFEALRRNGIALDTSLNSCHAISGPDLRQEHTFGSAFNIHGVTTFPVTVLRDGLGNNRPAQVGACSFAEMHDALLSASDSGAANFVIVSHNFEMLRIGSSMPDWIVVKRFQRLCAFLAQHRGLFDVRGFSGELCVPDAQRNTPLPAPRANLLSTSKRYLEQALRRLH